jgi:hypothetical protein
MRSASGRNREINDLSALARLLRMTFIPSGEAVLVGELIPIEAYAGGEQATAICSAYANLNLQKSFSVFAVGFFFPVKQVT